MAKAAKKAEPKVEKPKAAPKAHYAVIADGGNAPGGAVIELEELGAIARRQLVDNKATQVTLLIKPVFEQGVHGAQRRDGVV